MTNERKMMDATNTTATPIGYSTGDICRMLSDLVVTENKYGEILVAGIPEEQSCLDSRRFTNAVTAFIESVKSGNSYDALSTLVFICCNYESELDNIVSYISNRNKEYSEWINSIKFDELHFNDVLLNKIWQIEHFNHKAAITLYGAVSYLADCTFPDIAIYNYFGDKANLSAIATNTSILFKEEWERESIK